MATPRYDLDDGVGRLVFSCTEQPEETPSRSILPDEQFDIGRKDFQIAFGINDLTISTHHLRFRCVVYNDDTAEQVAPMVYVRVLSTNPIQLSRTRTLYGYDGDVIWKIDPDTLLNHGDILQLTPTISLLFSKVQAYESSSVGLDRIQKAETERFRDQFDVSDRKLGSGGQGSVFLAVKQSVQRQVACKVVPLPFTETAASERLEQNMLLTEQQRHAEKKKIERRLVHKRECLAREFNILKDLSHPNIVTLEKVICGTYNLYIFQELITGGDLLSYLDQKGTLDESESAMIILQLLKAVDYLHSNGVVHRDIKPENVLMTSWRDGARIVLTDFGQSRTINETQAATKNAVFRMQSVVGTHGYAAPEVFVDVNGDLQKRNYSKAIDIWSIGCITATLLTNELIFPKINDDGEDLEDAHSSPQHERTWDLSVVDHGRRWSNITRRAKDFVKECLAFDESQRLTAKKALDHKWFTHQRYAALIDAVYEKATKDWKPRTQSGNVVQVIDTTDVVAPWSRPEYVKRLAEEVKSHYFQDFTPPIPRMCAFAPAYSGTTQQHRVRTRLPAISADVEADRGELPPPPSVTQFENLLASPIRAPESTQFSIVTYGEPMAPHSIEDFAPPETQLPTRQSSFRAPEDTNGSLTQSQLTPDMFSFPSYAIDDETCPMSLGDADDLVQTDDRDCVMD